MKYTRVIPLLQILCLSIPLVKVISATNQDPYEVLELRHDANMDQIKKAYREGAKRIHPDKSNLNETEAAAKFVELTRAYKAIQAMKTSSMEHQEKEALPKRVLSRSLEYLTILSQVVLQATSDTSTTLLLLAVCLIATSFTYWAAKLLTTKKSAFLCRNQHSNKIDLDPNQDTQSDNLYSNLKIIELKLETYNGMVRLLKPGQRSIVLLCDGETKELLIKQFRKAVWPYRRNKSLLFGHLCLDKNLNWYKTILQEMLGLESLNINKKNCIGTVLSLNGFKKYFRLYHTKYKESNYAPTEDEDGSFLGFSNENDIPKNVEEGLVKPLSEAYEAAKDNYPIESLLDELPDWLDRMFEGQTKKYFLEQWPEEMI